MSQQSRERIAVLLGGTSSSEPFRYGAGTVLALLARALMLFRRYGRGPHAQLQAANSTVLSLLSTAGSVRMAGCRRYWKSWVSPSRARPVLLVPWRWISKSPNTFGGA